MLEDKKEKRPPFPVRNLEPGDYEKLQTYMSDWFSSRKLTIREAEAIIEALKDDLKLQICGGFRQ